MMYEGYHFWGMHLIWWFIWVIAIISVFGWYEPVPKKKIKRESPLDILQRRLASGEITKEEYEERRSILERDASK